MIAIWTIESLRSLLFPLLAFILFSERLSVVLIGAPAVSLVGAIGRYLRFRYELTDTGLVVTGGLLNRYRRVAAVARVQGVDVVQKLRHRIAGVIELRVEMAGGGGVVLPALAPDEAARLVIRLSPQTDKDGEPPPPLARLGPRDLLLAGMTGGRVAVLAALIGYAFQIVPQETLLGTLKDLIGKGSSLFALVLLGGTVFLLLSFVLSVVITILVHWDFTVRRENDRLVVTRGLLELRRSSVPLRRVQAVTIEENLIRRVFGLASLSLVVAGFAGKGEEQRETSTLLPIARRHDALRLAATALDTRLEGIIGALDAAAARALGRRLVYACLLGICAGVAGIAVLGAEGATAFLVALPAVGIGVGSYRALGHRIEPTFAVVRSGFWVRRTTVVPVNNIQHLKLTASPVQRALRLSTLRLCIPRARPSAVDLDRDRARARFAELSTGMLRTVPIVHRT